MYGRGRMGYAGGRWELAPYGRPYPPRFMTWLVVGLSLLFVAGPAFHFLPLLLLIWVIPLLLGPAFVAAARGFAGLMETRTRARTDRVTQGSKERELLEALAWRGELSPALAALETSLTVAEADRMLSDLAESGHVEVRAHDGRLGYALWEQDRRRLTEGPSGQG
jgi:hypothetical protein